MRSSDCRLHARRDVVDVRDVTFGGDTAVRDRTRRGLARAAERPVGRPLGNAQDQVSNKAGQLQGRFTRRVVTRPHECVTTRTPSTSG
jgi:hypothetical protein